MTQQRHNPTCRDCPTPVPARKRLCCECRLTARRKTKRLAMRKWRAKRRAAETYRYPIAFYDEAAHRESPTQEEKP